jgi:hypothetical protein
MRHDGGDTLKSQDYHAGLRVLPLKAMECAIFHIQSDYVVNQGTPDGDSSAHRDFLLLHDM